MCELLIFTLILRLKDKVSAFFLLTYQNVLFSITVSPSLQSVCFYCSLLLLRPSIFLQEEKGISCELVDLDFLKCSVGFPFMRAQTKVAPSNLELNLQCQKA